MGAPRLEGGCEVIEKQEISELARELSLDLHVVEKDYVLGWLLAGIAANTDLSENWVFKGGTCLKKCYFETYRFSEDLDFSLIKKITQKQFEDVIKKIVEFLPNVKIKELIEKRYTYFALIWVKEPYLRQAFSIKIEVSKKDLKKKNNGYSKR